MTISQRYPWELNPDTRLEATQLCTNEPAVRPDAGSGYEVNRTAVPYGRFELLPVYPQVAAHMLGKRHILDSCFHRLMMRSELRLQLFEEQSIQTLNDPVRLGFHPRRQLLQFFGPVVPIEWFCLCGEVSILSKSRRVFGLRGNPPHVVASSVSILSEARRVFGLSASLSIVTQGLKGVNAPTPIPPGSTLILDALVH